MLRNFLVTLLAAFALHAHAAVDANRASQAELETVKGIGPALSAKILKARETGTFKDWADMVERVPGIGAGNAAKFSQAGLTVGDRALDGTALAAPAPDKRKSAKASKGGADAAPPARKGGAERS